MKKAAKSIASAFLSAHLKSIIKVELIHTGESVLSYKVTTSDAVYFVKNIADNYTENIEEHCNDIAAKAKISPKLYSTEKGYLISEFIEGENLQTKIISLKDKISITIELMYQFHQLFIEIPKLNISTVLLNLCTHEYYQPSQLNLLTNIINQLTNNINVGEYCLCHGDANFSNILTTENSNINYLIDFECACLADAEYDIAMFLAINCIPKQYHDDVFNCYQHYNTTFKVNTSLVKQYLCVAHLINGLWYINKAFGDANNKSMFEHKAAIHFSFFDQYSVNSYALANKMR